MSKTSELAGRELDAALADALGWELAYFPKCGYRLRRTRGRGHWESAPSFSCDLNACRSAELALKAKMGNEFWRYGDAVRELCGPRMFGCEWLLVDAETRCRAILAVLHAV